MRADRSLPDHPAAIKALSGSLKNFAQLPTFSEALAHCRLLPVLRRHQTPPPPQAAAIPLRISVPGSRTAVVISNRILALLYPVFRYGMNCRAIRFC